MKHAVLNASPVIVLARAGYLDLIPKLVSSPVIPRAVANEIQAGRSDDPAVEFLSSANWLDIADLTPPLSPLAVWRLGQGESEVLEYAQRSPGTIAVLDDKAARRLAVALSIPVVGTLGLLLAARQSRLLPSLQVAMDRVKSCGLFVDDAVAWRIISMGEYAALRASAWRSREEVAWITCCPWQRSCTRTAASGRTDLR